MSTEKTGINLDHLAARRAQSLVKQGLGTEQSEKNIDNLVTKSLGVLQENGVYACFLFLKSRSGKEEKELAGKIVKETVGYLWDLNESLGFGWKEKPNTESYEKLFQFLTDNVLHDLNRLLALKEGLERMMIYARYGAKAADKEDK